MTTFEEWIVKYFEAMGNNCEEIPHGYELPNVLRDAYAAGRRAGLAQADSIVEGYDRACFCEGDGYSTPLLECGPCRERGNIMGAIKKSAEEER